MRLAGVFASELHPPLAQPLLQKLHLHPMLKHYNHPISPPAACLAPCPVAVSRSATRLHPTMWTSSATQNVLQAKTACSGSDHASSHSHSPASTRGLQTAALSGLVAKLTPRAGCCCSGSRHKSAAAWSKPSRVQVPCNTTARGNR
jgi:hypothetical protein